jgi:hypothetical protein
MNCKNCGAENTEESTFYNKCRSNLNEHIGIYKEKNGNNLIVKNNWYSNKKIIVIIIGFIFVLLISGFMINKNVSTNIRIIRIPKNFELKAQYSKDISNDYADNFKQCTLESISIYKNLDTLNMSDVSQLSKLTSILIAGKDKSAITPTEFKLVEKLSPLGSDLIQYSKSNNESVIKLKTDLQALLDCYK